MLKVLEANVDDKNQGGVFALIKEIILQKTDGIHIDVCSIERFEGKENIELLNKAGVKIFFVGYEGNKIKKQIKAINNEILLYKEEGYDIVHIHADTAYRILIYAIAAKQAGIRRIILHSHSTGVEGKYKSLRRMIHILSRYLLPFFSTEYVACSDVAAKWMFGTTRRTVKIIYNGVDLTKFRFNQEARLQERKKLGVTKEYLIGHVGRFSYPKNHEYIIKIAAALKQKNVDDFKFLLIGTGPLYDPIKNLAKKLEVEDKMIFFGLSHEVPRLMQAMDLVVLPSRFEGFPLVGIEAQASGLPVIFSDKITKEIQITDNTEFLSISEDSIFQWADEIIRLLKMSMNDRETAYTILKNKGYDITETARQFSELYNT